MLRTLVLDIVQPGTPRSIADENLQELLDLIATAGGIVVKKIIQRRGKPSQKTFLGSGKILEAGEFSKAENIDLVIINDQLKPNQYLFLGKVFEGVKIWDRVDLILQIFDAHASAPEAKTQINLARLHHDIPKIYARESTTLFERAGAGIGTRGAGEKGIEEEKRHIRAQIKSLETRLKNFQKKQGNQRRARQKTGMPTVALVGYTNAGKSSLMKALTKKDVRIDNALFVTLETKIGRAFLPSLGTSVLMADTIGFIRDLPPRLVASFLTTLQEASEADLLLHVVDISDPRFREKIAVVDTLLEQIHCAHIPQVLVLNKADALPDLEKIDDNRASFLPIRNFSDRTPVLVSAAKKIHLKELKEKIASFF